MPSCKQLIVFAPPNAPAPVGVVLDAEPGPDIVTLAQYSGAQPRPSIRSRPRRRTPLSFFIRPAPRASRKCRAHAPQYGHERMVSAELCAGSADETGRHATAVTLPLFHATAQTAQMLAYFHLGGTLAAAAIDPAALLAVMASERVTHWIGVPTMY